MVSKLTTEPVGISNVSSTYHNEIYSINNFIPIIEIENKNGSVVNYLDFLDHRLTRLLSLITVWVPYTFDGTEHITSISYKAYKTTTLWWVIIMYNGFIHPLEIPPGTTLKIPNLNQVNDYLRDVKKRIGKVVQI